MHDRDRYVDRRTVLGSVGIGLVGLAGCTGDDGDGGDGDGGDGGNETDGDGGDGGGEISATGVWSGGEEEDFRAVMEFVEGETGLSIEYHPRTTDALLTNTLMDYEAGVAPADIVVMPSPARIRSDAGNGHLEAIGGAWNAENFAVDPDRVTIDGDVYAAPFKMDLKPGFWYRQSFFEDNDLSVPEDYDGFLSLLEEIDGIEGVDAPIASGNGTGWPLSDITEGFIMRQEDGAQFQQNLINGDADFTDERFVNALEEIQSLHQEGYFSELREFGVQYEYFWDNSTPLYFMGSFTPAQEAVQDPSDLGVFRLPGVEGITSSVNWFTVPAYSDNVDDATQALEHFVSAEGQRVWVERGGFIASNTQVPEDAYDLEVMAQLPDMADEVTVVPDLDDALGNPFQEEFWSQLTGLWANPDSDLQTIAERLESVQDETLEGGDGS